MADYTTTLLMRQTLPSIGSVTTVQSADLAIYITAAESVINAKLARFYTVPITPAPPVLQTLATDLSLYRLLVMRFYTQEQMNNSVWPDRFKEAMTTLDAIASGAMPLVSGSGTTIPAAGGLGAMHSSTLNYQQTFTEDKMENQFVDSEKIDDIQALR